jgi:protein TonB
MAGAILLVVAGSLLPVQLLTGCAREQEAPAQVAPPVALQDAIVPATPPVDTARPPDVDSPSPDEFVAVEEMPVLVTPPRPVYPEEARLHGVEGVVTVRALVSKDGKIPDCFAVDGAALLREAALTAVKAATFKPAQQSGRPVAVWVQIPIRFSLH